MKRPQRLTKAKRDAILKHIPIGGDLITVCNFAGVTVAQLRLEMKRDPAFAEEVARAEATVELRHMGQVSKASQDEKNWRSSVWWIERRSRARAADDSRVLSEAHFVELLDELAQVIVTEFPEPAIHRRVIEAMNEVYNRDVANNATFDPPRDDGPAGLLASDVSAGPTPTDHNPPSKESQS